MSLPGIGAKVADKILELRDAKGDLELDDLNQVPYLRLTPQLINCLGSLYDRHRERVRSVDKLIRKWDGTGQGQATGRGKDRGQFDESHQQGESPIIVSRKGTGGNSHIHPIDLKMIIASWMQLS